MTPSDEVLGSGPAPTASVELYWIPLGVGASIVRCSGQLFEAIDATIRRRRRCDLYHSALVITGGDGPYVIEMAPVPDEVGHRQAELSLKVPWEQAGSDG